MEAGDRELFMPSHTQNQRRQQRAVIVMREICQVSSEKKDKSWIIHINHNLAALGLYGMTGPCTYKTGYAYPCLPQWIFYWIRDRKELHKPFHDKSHIEASIKSSSLCRGQEHKGIYLFIYFKTSSWIFCTKFSSTRSTENIHRYKCNFLQTHDVLTQDQALRGTHLCIYTPFT